MSKVCNAPQEVVATSWMFLIHPNCIVIMIKI